MQPEKTMQVRCGGWGVRSGLAASLILGLMWGVMAQAAVINVEFKFTPFLGDPAKVEQVQAIPGTARVYLNNVLVVDQPVRQAKLPVIFDTREIAPSVWVPVASLGPMLRKGRNRIRVDFVPDDVKLAYRAQLRWASVNDVPSEEQREGSVRATNQSDEGVEDKPGLGALSMEREFSADFASEQPWHKYPAITALGESERKELAGLLKARANAFKPRFEGLYKILKGHPQVKVSDVKRIKCLDKAYAAGLRIALPPPEQLDIVLSGGPEVVVRRKNGDQLFQPNDPGIFEKLKVEEVQMCAGTALYAAYPPRLVLVRNPEGAWEVAY